MIVEDAEPIESVKMVMVRLSPQQAMNTNTQNSLRGILQRQAGEKKQPSKVPVVAIANRLQFYVKVYSYLYPKFYRVKRLLRC